MSSMSEATSNENFIINNTELNTTLDDADDDVFARPPPSKRGKARIYETIINFSTFKEANHWVENSLEPWKRLQSTIDTQYYKCRKASISEAAKQIPLDQKRKRGAPTKAKGALVRQVD